jgi:diaminohydroxyphosphoribosylaminopyrimidine deaminase/5-amino-6-(5-phosphoribosylamino)uracil reductase
MNLAIEEAWKRQLLTYPNPAVGGLLLDKNGKIIAISAHQEAGKPHSEVLLFKNGYLHLTGDTGIERFEKSNDIRNYLYENSRGLFKGTTLYTTLEPCHHYGKTPPCSLLIQKMGVDEVVIGYLDDSSAGGGASYLESYSKVTVLNSKESRELLEPFLIWQEKTFLFFKYAQTLNGNISDGVISSKESRTFVHEIRTKIDLLIIGGNTVRTDRPTLDSRLINGKAPDILILSKEKEFDRTIPLFQVPDRKVYIDNNLERVSKYKFVMVEGGYSLLKEILKEIDMLLLFISPKLREFPKGEFLESDFQLLHSRRVGDDTLLYLKKDTEESL